MNTLQRLKAGQLKGQKRLDLACGLTELPPEVFDLADSLELLNLSNNRLSHLPDDLGRLKKLKIVFFNNNQFTHFPAVLADCPALSMVSFKNNAIAAVDEAALAPTIRWLILTNNQLQTLPDAIGKLSRLQKLMLAGNQLTHLPETLAACRNLELIRLSANRLTTLPDWLWSLPRLSWLAYAGNPYCAAETKAQEKRSQSTLPQISADELQLGAVLGQGASGVIYQGQWAAQLSQSAQPSQSAQAKSQAKSHTKSQLGSQPESQTKPQAEPQTVAVKIFKGEMTSDGLPQDEMRACMAAGRHPNLVNVLGQYQASASLDQTSDQSSQVPQSGLVFSFIPATYQNLGGPPDLDSCTRDTYPEGTSFTLSVALKIVQGIAAAVAHLHAQGIMHGDLYAHNILVNAPGESILGDFGAASFFDSADGETASAIARLEVRAFGCLLEDLLDRCVTNTAAERERLSQLRQLQQSCMQSVPNERPTFAAIAQVLLT